MEIVDPELHDPRPSANPEVACGMSVDVSAPALVDPLDAGELERWAEATLPRAVFDFVAGGADDEVTLADNQCAFTRVKIVPRTLRDVETVDTSTTLLGLGLRAPMLV